MHLQSQALQHGGTPRTAIKNHGSSNCTRDRATGSKIYQPGRTASSITAHTAWEYTHGGKSAEVDLAAHVCSHVPSLGNGEELAEYDLHVSIGGATAAMVARPSRHPLLYRTRHHEMSHSYPLHAYSTTSTATNNTGIHTTVLVKKNRLKSRYSKENTGH